MAITNRQLGMLHAIRRQLGLADDDWRDMLRRVAGVESSKDLAPDALDTVLDHLEAAGATIAGRSRRAAAAPDFGQRPGMASSGQVKYIRDLWMSFTDGAGTPRSLDKWLERQFKVSSLRFLDSDMAQRAIGGLLRMTAKRRHKTASALASEVPAA